MFLHLLYYTHHVVRIIFMYKRYIAARSADMLNIGKSGTTDPRVGRREPSLKRPTVATLLRLTRPSYLSLPRTTDGMVPSQGAGGQKLLKNGSRRAYQYGFDPRTVR